MDVMHRKYGIANKRSRSGYDDTLGITLRSKSSISDFIASKDPVRMLTDVNEMFFTHDCTEYEVRDPCTLHPALLSPRRVTGSLLALVLAPLLC